MAGISNESLVGLCALVPIGTAFVDLLVSVSVSIDVEKDAVACRCIDAGGQYCSGRQRDAVSAN